MSETRESYVVRRKGILSKQEKEMITADEARKLYVQPPYTLGEIEAQIRNRAAGEFYTFVDNLRLTDELRVALKLAGYALRIGAQTTEISWKTQAEITA